MNPCSFIKQPKSIISVLATSLLALATISVLAACSPKPSADESAAQTKALIDKAVEDTKKQMLAEKDKQDAMLAAQAEEKAKQDAAVAQAVANAKKEFAAEQHAVNAKKERRIEQRAEQRASTTAAAAKPDDYSPSPVPEKASVCTHCAVVLSVKEIETEGSGSGLGVVAGGVVGGVLGNQVGNGAGRDLATIAGALGGAFAGNKIEKVAKKTKSYDIVVKMDTGEERTFNQLALPHVISGDKVKIENNVIIKR